MFFLIAILAIFLAWVAVLLGIFFWHQAQDAARAERLEAALKAVLLFHSGEMWGEESRKRWFELTGTNDCTTKNLCDCVRKALG